ncbi:MAG: hypothetical protein ABI822_17370 [Bryobacteraceae bacterium]
MLGGAVAGHTAAWGHDLRPGDPSYRFQDYEAIVNPSAQVRLTRQRIYAGIGARYEQGVYIGNPEPTP